MIPSHLYSKHAVWMPLDIFQETYIPVENANGSIPFHLALDLVKQGSILYRSKWVEASLWQGGNNIHKCIFCIDAHHLWHAFRTNLNIEPYLYNVETIEHAIFVIDNSKIYPYIPTIDDLNALDWQVRMS